MKNRTYKDIDNPVTANNCMKIFFMPFLGFGLLFMLVINANSCKAQGWDEWFNQKKTQIKYLTQQIAALQSCESSLKQGYNIAKGGLGSISGFTGSEMGFHKDYYASLKAVNPQIKNNTTIDNIILYQQAITRQFNLLLNLQGLSSGEISYILSVRTAVLKECNNDLNELQTVITPGSLQMADDERIKRINKVAGSMKDKFVFSQSFTDQVKTLSLQKNREMENIKTLGRYYGNDN